MSLIKKSIHSVLRSFGYRIEKINTFPKKWVDVKDAVNHNSLENLNKFYSDDDLLTEYVNDERLAFYKTVNTHLKAKNINVTGKTVVDVGCGTGHLLHFINEDQKFKHGTGLEYSPEAVKLAKKLFPAFDFFEYDINKRWGSKYDLVICTEVLEHLLDPGNALNNLIDMCAENGQILITVPNGRIDTFGGHINFWSPESWSVFIKSKAGNNNHETGTLANDVVNYAIIKKSGL